MCKIRAAIAAPLPFLVCYIIKVVQLITLQVVDRIVIGNAPRIVIEFCKRHVSLIPLCNLVVKYHNKLCKILVVTFPLIKGTFESVFNGCDTKGICNREVLPKNSHWLVPYLTLDVPNRNFYKNLSQNPSALCLSATVLNVAISFMFKLFLESF